MDLPVRLTRFIEPRNAKGHTKSVSYSKFTFCDEKKEIGKIQVYKSQEIRWCISVGSSLLIKASFEMC